MITGGPSVFLERQSYRRRRMMDAARFLPVLGALLFAVPLLWPKPDSAAVLDGAVQPVTMSGAMLYVFLIWAVLIACAGIFGILARRWSERDQRDQS
jgi:hypothetical protein